MKQPTTLPASIIVSTSLASSIAPLPVWLLSALAVIIGNELNFSESQLGLAVSAYFAAAAVVSVPIGRVSERIGPKRALYYSTMLSGITLGAFVFARDWKSIVFLLVLAGIASGWTQPATYLALERAVSQPQQGVAIGIKSASVPFAAMIAGAVVPTVGLTIGWRWAYAGAAFATVIFLLFGRIGDIPTEKSPSFEIRGAVDVLPMTVLSVGAAFGVAASLSVTAFYVPYLVASGLHASLAGTWFAFGGLCGLLGRIAWGHLVDRTKGDGLSQVSLLMVGGSIGVIGLAAIPDSPYILFFSTLLAFAFGWGWSGVFSYAIVQRNREAPAVASAIVGVGIRVGGVVGPLAFGSIVALRSYAAAWGSAAISGTIAATLIVIGRWLVSRESGFEVTAEPQSPTMST